MTSRRARRAQTAAALAAFACALPHAAAAQSAASNIAGFDRIHTDKIDFNINNGDFTIPDAFSASRDGMDITADHATGNSKAKRLHAEGHVVVHQNQPLADHGKVTDLSQRPSTLTSDTLDVDGVRKLYVATGNMHFTQEGGRDATADRATLDDSTHMLHMEGHVHVKNGDETISSDVLDYNTQTGQLDGNGNVTITSPVASPGPGDTIARPRKIKIPIIH